jgi:adenylate cyclase
VARRRGYRLLTAAACAALAAAIALAAPSPLPFDGPLLDALIRARAIAATPPPEDASPVVVIAVDERTLERDEFAQHPRALFAPVWGRLVDVVSAAGARAIGFDILFTYSASRLAPDHDRPFLAALAEHRERVVLARSARALPAPPFLAALDPDDHSLGLAEIVPDPDGVHRMVRRAYRTESDEDVPSLSAALLARAGGPAMPESVRLTPRRHPEAIPTYALGDVLACADAAPNALARALEGRIVLVGTTLPDEDRKISSARFLPAPGPGRLIDGCGLRHLGASTRPSSTTPGVHLHAMVIDAVGRGAVTGTVSASVVAALGALLAGAIAMVALSWSPWHTLGVAILTVGAVVAGATALLDRNVWVPIGLPLAAIVVAPALGYVVRYLAEERTRRRIEVAFGRYVSPHVVERLAASQEALRLGGERRDVSVMFADLSGFTALSTRVSPEVLTQLTNRYLAYIVDAVEATGGYVDKFIGDAVMAIWGAPVGDGRHALHALEAALAARESIEAARAAARRQGQAGFSVKIGIHSGSAVVGNVGTERRYNYTAVGETVNVAARLEGVPGVYGCAIVVSEPTATLAGDAIVFRELDRIRVKGREEAMTIFEPLGATATIAPATLRRRDAYESALADYRARRFTEASKKWSAMTAMGLDAEADGPASTMAARAQDFAAHPPPQDWDGVWVLTGK